MKEYKKHLVVKTGSQIHNKKIEENKVLDIIFVSKRFSLNNLKIGKEISKSGKTARYYNKFWRLGTLDSDLLKEKLLIKQDRDLATDPKLDTDLSLVRKKKISMVFMKLIGKVGLFKTIYIFNLYLLNQILNKIKKFS